MLKRLQDKWKVGGIQLVLILCVFTIGGSTSGYLGRTLLTAIPLPKGVIWWLAYFILVTCLWPICVLVISIPFGQFKFFKAYLKQLGNKIFRKR